MAVGEHIEIKDAQAYLRRVRETTGRDLTSIARRAGVNPSTVTGIMSPTPRTKTVRIATIEAIARTSGLPFDGGPSPVASWPGGASGGMPRDVPIHALLAVPGRLIYHWNQIPADYALRPPFLASSRKVFALRMPDRTMEGWRMKNELVYVDPAVEADEGDHAFVEIANLQQPDGPSLFLIRRLLSDRGDRKVLGSWGLRPDQTEFPDNQVVRASRVIEWPELAFG